MNRRFLLPIWALLATANLSAGVVIASWPERQQDLDTMRNWCANWLGSGTNVYASSYADYPPHAIVALSPIVVLPFEWAIPLWAALNLALAVAVSYLVVRVGRSHISLSEAALPMLMFLCWGGFRTLLQFTLLTLTFALLAMLLARRWPAWSGLCLGLALIKPQIAAPFFLWTLFTRRLRVAAIAVLVCVAGMVVFCIRAQVSALTVTIDYLRVLSGLYTGQSAMIGLSQLRPLMMQALPNATVADALAVSIALAMLVFICRWGFHEAGRGKTLLYSAPALAAVWSLLTFYHLTYGFLLLLPAAGLLLFDDDATTITLRTRLFWIMQFGLMFDVPGLWRRFGVDAPAIIGDIVTQLDRILMLTIFAGLALLAMKAHRTPLVEPTLELEHTSVVL